DRDGAVKAQRFDPSGLRLQGPAIEVPGLRAISPDANGSPIVSASATGTLVQRAALDLPERLSLVDRQGRAITDLTGPSGTYLRGSLAPDGKSAAFEYTPSGSAAVNIWWVDLVRGTFQPMTFEGAGGFAGTPAFSPDGRQIAVSRVIPGRDQDLWMLR